ncbi:TrkH family potassium uptake protein [Maridesulfovibrio ferrireducens]|uniref:TrkH family potassium uptake protein n=1 Tax=Maridesulfovibrio ferrireducens TaxID=246191 RepID=UPI001A2ACBE8|nr:TrkH family potassium uptake protein [Maridesulfovibrio ferrireducens]MBI9111409.1 TrkH family potassium uptake protein [Maridesulfovibrio ferrireducens]
MRWKVVLHIIGALILCVGLTMIMPLAFSLYYQDSGIMPLIQSMLISCLCGLGLFLVFRSKDENQGLSHREGMAIVALGWVAAGFFGSLPFYFGDVFSSNVDCFFESLSGFTTTGSSVMTDIESVAKGILFWRSLTHWLGGMGIIVLSLAILPFLGVGGMQLYKAEVPGPVPDKLKPRIKDTAIVLWKVYLLFSAIEAILLMLGGMDFFDSLCHTFGTLATGGFSTKNTSVAYFNSAYIDYVITFFMIVAGINFSLHYQMLKGRPLILWRDPEFRFFASITALITVIVTIVVYSAHNYETVADTVRYTSFQVASIMSTTGFATADYELWPALAQGLLLLCMFLGGCAGSTSGGMKHLRIMLLLKQSYQQIFRIIHPRSVNRVKLGKKVIKPETMNDILGFAVLWIGLFVLCGLIVAATGVDVVSSFAASLACIGNIGPGIGTVGPADNFSHIPEVGKWALIFCMLLGRLEIYTVIVLCVPEFWRK